MESPQEPAQPNLTPDVSAALLGTIAGILVGGLVAFLARFLSGGLSNVMFWLLFIFVFGIAAALSWICRHMELTGHRHFRQGFSFVIPLTVVYFTSEAIVNQVSSRLVTLTESGSAGIAQVLPSNSMGTIISFTAVFAIAGLGPFFFEAKRSEPVRAIWFWPLVAIVALCAISWWIITGLVV